LKVQDALKAVAQVVPWRIASGDHFRQTAYVCENSVDFSLAVERFAAPGGREIAPLDEVCAGGAKPIKRTSLFF